MSSQYTIFVLYIRDGIEPLDGNMDATNQEVNSEGIVQFQGFRAVAGIVRDVIDYPDDEIETANRDANSEVHQTQPVSGIVREAIQPLATIIRQANSNTSQSGKSLCLEWYIQR